MENTQELTLDKRYLECKAIINDAVVSLLNESQGKRPPTYQQIADYTGLHYNTVANHYKNLKFNPIESTQRSLTDNVIVNLFNLSKKSPAACKLWFQVMEGWQEKQESDPIIINNNINEMTTEQIEKAQSFIASLTNG